MLSKLKKENLYFTQICSLHSFWAQSTVTAVFLKPQHKGKQNAHFQNPLKWTIEEIPPKCQLKVVNKKGKAIECSNYHTIALISHASKVTLKILQPGFSNTWTMNFLMFKLVLEKAEEPEIKLPTSDGSSKKQEFQKNIYLCFIDYAKAFDCMDHN